MLLCGLFEFSTVWSMAIQHSNQEKVPKQTYERHAIYDIMSVDLF